MKGVMYHYVREQQDDLPWFTYLHIDDFECQLDWFMANHHVATQQEFEHALTTGTPLKNAVVLTFDDGLLDHYQYVRPALVKRGLWGIFYVPTKPYVEAKLLDVHRVHYLLGHLGGEQLLSLVKPKVNESMMLAERRHLLEANTYRKQNNHQAVTEVKRLFNYFLKPEYKASVLDALMQEVVPDEAALAQQFYLTQAQIAQMIADGLAIGNHAHSHTLLSNLSESQQAAEIKQSSDILQDLTQGKLAPSFCFPYGGKQSYTDGTLKLLADNGYQYGFSVDSRDIRQDDLLYAKFELPRYDCNEFPHGAAVVEGRIRKNP